MVINIMLRLKNIKRENNFIEAYYTPEDKEEQGYIKIDINTDVVVEKRLTNLDSEVATYFAMARNKLRTIKNDEDLPKNLLVMWY